MSITQKLVCPVDGLTRYMPDGWQEQLGITELMCVEHEVPLEPVEDILVYNAEISEKILRWVVWAWSDQAMDEPPKPTQEEFDLTVEYFGYNVIDSDGLIEEP
jgi:hypothetical protein